LSPDREGLFAEFDQNQLFRDIIGSLPVGAAVVSQDMGLVYANGALLEGFPADCRGDCASLGHLLRCRHMEGNGFACGSGVLSEGGRKSCPEPGRTFAASGGSGTKWFRVRGKRIQFCGEAYALLSFEDVTGYVRREDILLKKLKLDLATETLNKYSLIEYINKLVNQKRPVSFTVSMIDFDNFKRINDRYGHVTGDRVLNTFSEISRKIIRSGDIIGRYGGEEFIFVFMGADLISAVGIIQRIQNELRTHFADVLTHPVTFSAGLLYVGGWPSGDSGCMHLIDRMDKLLYQAKKCGKNRIIVADNACFPD